MRILMLTQFYPPLLGGIEQHVHTLSTELVRRGHDVTVATIQHKGHPAFEVEQGVRIYRIRSSVQRLPWLFSSSERQYPPPCPDPELIAALQQIVTKERPEIVHAHNWLVRSFLPLKRRSKARLVMTLHNYGLTCAKVSYMHGNTACSGPGISKCLSCATKHYGLARAMPTVFSNWIMNGPERAAIDMFLPVSQAVADGNNLAGRHLPFQVIPNFIADDPASSQDDPSSYLEQLPQGEYLLFVGGLAHVKGVETLLRAYSTLENVPPLVLIGYETQEWPELARYCSPNVFVFKNWPHYAVMAAWKRCTLALIPSIFPDPCPTVAMEAMSAGKPIIAARSGGLTDIVADGETGLLVPPGDVRALQEAILTMLSDRVRLEEMGKKARERVPLFQTQSVIPRIEHVYRELLLV